MKNNKTEKNEKNEKNKKIEKNKKNEKTENHAVTGKKTQPAKKTVRTKNSLVGQRFGKLTVESRSGTSSNGYAMYHCVCDCGGTVDVESRLLRSQHKTSCGCENNRRTRMVDLTGMRKGRLTVLEPLDKRDYKGCIIWRCRCDCGQECEYSGDALRNANVCSCGCYRREKASERMKAYGAIRREKAKERRENADQKE